MARTRPETASVAPPAGCHEPALDTRPPGARRLPRLRAIPDCSERANSDAGSDRYIDTVPLPTVTAPSGPSRPGPESPMSTRDVVFPEGRRALYELHRYSPAVRSN